ncbi:MAG TPA: carbohydrate binding domain-containing protein [Marmoricola sp.]|nr:carbohydrate binding domain-containing protein [Marmoricola sp.]
MRGARVRTGRAVPGRLSVAVVVLGLGAAMAAPAGASPAPRAERQRPAPGHGVVRAFEQHRWFTAERGIPHPVAVTALDRSGLLAVADRRAGGARISLLDPARDRVVGRMRVAGLGSAVTLADDGHGVLAVLDGHRLLTWPATARGAVRPDSTRVVGALGRPAGMAWDPATRGWLVLDAAGHRLVRLGSGHGVARARGGADLAGLGPVRLHGLGVDPASGLVYVAAPARHRVYAVDGTGALRNTYRVSGVPAFTTLAFGPTADPTDSAGVTSLYTAAAGSTAGPAPVLGRVSEVSLTPLGSAAAPAPELASGPAPSVATSTATLVRKTLLSQLSPPSPDPSGVVYQSDVDRLLVVDSEVDEMSIYKGVNMWQLTRAGSSVQTGTTLGFSKEPTGVGYDPVGKRMFVSDDDRQKIFQVTTGPDNRFGTGDDVVTSFSTIAFGDDDPEDVTYDTTDKALYITQGVGQEVWRVAPGPDGRFDGIAPTGDDQVTHFDTSVYGITDLEGIGYSPTRNSLFLMDRTYTQIVEVTTKGALVQKIDVAAIGMKNPAAITLGPASNDPTRTSIYVTVRGVDNDNHPDENDGVMYELSAPNIGPVNQAPNTAPVVSAGQDSTVSLPAAAILDGTVTDDGLPDPPGFTTATWTQVSGPGAVTFADEHAVDTTATISATGTYVLRLSVSDGELTTADDVTITAVSNAPTNTAPVVDAGPDQTVDLPASASLSGMVTDDGLPNPPGTTTIRWSQVSGPGSVSFTAPGSATTNASFTEPGTYVLRLSASDSALESTDDVTVVANPAPPTGNLVTNPGFETDTSGWKSSSGTTLARVSPGHTGNWAAKLVNSGSSQTTCTLNDSPDTVSRTNPGTYQASAWVRGDSAGAGTTMQLRIREYAGTTLVGTQSSSLTLSTSWQRLVLDYVPVSPGSSHLDVNLLRWTPAGAVCFQVDDIVVGTTTQPVANQAPKVDAGPDQAVTLPDQAMLSGTVTDDGLPNPPGATTVHWSQVSGPGTVTFGSPDAKATAASFSAAGSYVLRLTATDSELSASDDLTVAVADASQPPPPTGNLVANPGFETDTAGWKGSSGTTLSRVSPGHTGSWAAKLVNSGTSSTTCYLNDSPDTVSTTVAGTYTASAWVLGDAASSGTKVYLRIREYAGSTLAGTASTVLTLSTGWQQVTVAYPVASPGSHLDVNLLRSTPAGATSFVVDDISVTGP